MCRSRLYICSAIGIDGNHKTNKMKIIDSVNTENLKVGDFVRGAFRYGTKNGIVLKVNKNTVVVNECRQFYDEFFFINQTVNITKKRIWQIGLQGNQYISQ